MSAQGLPTRCPSCGGHLAIERLRCEACGTEVNGHYHPCPVCALGAEDRLLLDRFLRARGNLKSVQRFLGVSYPTARQRIDALLAKLDLEPAPADPAEVLRRLARGEIDVDTAERLLRGV